MTVDAARRTRRRGPKAGAAPDPTLDPIAPTPSIAIGEIDQTVFDCPSCSRPLALGARRCPGCGTRLLNGVSLGKVSGFVAAGLAIGLLIGAGGGLAFGLTHPIAGEPAAAAAAPSAAPGSQGAGAVVAATPSATATPASTPTPTAAIPPLARSALVQVVGTNDRLATAAGGLRSALAAKAFDASAVAQILRTVSADSVFGEQLADTVAGWPGSSALGAQLRTFYGTIHDTAANGLVASVRNQAVYRAAAVAMVNLLAELPAVDAAVHSTAASAGVDLPTASGAPTAP